MKEKIKRIFKTIAETIKKIINIIITKTKENKQIIIPIVGLLIIIIALLCISDARANKSTITYNRIEKIIKNKETAVIYYFNSKSSNKNNVKTRRYLDKLKINYYKYNDKDIDKKEYNKFIELLKLDKKLFSPPSIIYIKDGRMYGNAINIDSKKVTKKFIDDYDLYTIK